jgi:hypothetical protein
MAFLLLSFELQLASGVVPGGGSYKLQHQLTANSICPGCGCCSLECSTSSNHGLSTAVKPGNVLYPRRLQKTYHAAGGAGVATGPVKFVVEALRRLDCTWKTGERLDRLHMRVHLWWVSRWIRRLLVVTGARCPLTKPVVTAVELQATTGPHCSRGVQPGGICAYVVQREPTPGGPGPGLCARPKALLHVPPTTR